MNEHLEDLKEDLRNKENVLRSYGSVDSAPTALLASIRGLMKEIAYERYDAGILNDEQLANALREADERFKAILKPQGGYESLTDPKSKEAAMEEIKNYPRRLETLSFRFKDDREIVLEAVKREGYVLQYASDKLRDDHDIVLEAVKQDGDSFKYASRRLRDDKELAIIAINGHTINALEFMSDRLKDDRELILMAIQKDGHNLAYASKRLRDDRELVVMAVTDKPDSIKHASDRLKDDPEIVRLSLRDHHRNLDDASPRLRNNRELVLYAVTENGLNLEYASPRLRNDYEIVKIAVTRNERAFPYASPRVRNVLRLLMVTEQRKAQSPKDYVNNSLLLDKEKTLRFIKTSFQMRLISTKLEYNISDSMDEVPVEIYDQMHILDDLYQRNVISYEFAIELMTNLFERDGIKKQFDQYIDDVLVSRMRELYEKLDSIYFDLLFALNTGKIDQKTFIDECAKIRESETLASAKVASIIDTLRGKAK